MTDSKKKRTRRSFSEEFNRETVELFQGSGVSAKQVGAELGISTSLLYRWVRDARDDPPEADQPSYKELEKELRRPHFPVVLMCPILHVCRSKYYAWRQRGRESPRARSDRRLLVLIRSLHQEWDGILSYRRMHACLQQRYGACVGRRRVRRLMRTAGIMGIPKKRRRQRRPGRVDRNIPDLLQREFSAQQPNQAWVTDITEFRTGEGKLYLCVFKDLYEGAIAAWKTSTRPTAEWVTSTVELARAKRPLSHGTILHSDHGSQYTSDAYRQCLLRNGLKISMGRVRTCADNASAESVFGLLKRQLVNRRQFRTRQEAIDKINQYFLNTYNSWRQVPFVSNQNKNGQQQRYSTSNGDAQ